MTSAGAARSGRAVVAPLLLALTPAAGAGGLAVTAVTPLGATDRVTQVTVQFSRPMVPLGRMARSPEEVPVALDCPATGSFRWLDQSTLAYLLDAPLPPSTGCTVRVKAGARALDGSVLLAEQSERLETRRVQIVRTEPATDAANQPLDPEITLTFNQPVRLASLGERLEFRWMGGKSPARVSEMPRPPGSGGAGQDEPRPPVDAERSYLVRPASPLPRDTAFELLVPAGLAAALGPLPSEEETKLAYRTYGPFRVVRFGCDSECRPGCDPDGALVLELSTPVDRQTAIRLVRVLAGHARRGGETGEGGDDREALASDDDGVDFSGGVTQVYLPGPWQPRTTARVEVPGELADVFGQRLGASQTLAAEVGPRWPIHDLGGRFGVYESRGEHRYPLLSRNLDDVVLRSRRIAREEVIPVLTGRHLLRDWDEGDDDPLRGLAAVKTTPLGPWGEPDLASYRPLDLDRLLGEPAAPGLLYLDVSSATMAKSWTCDRKKPYDRALVQLTDLGLSVKFGEADTLIRVTSLAGALPLPGTRLEIRDGANQVVWSGSSGADGVAIAPGKSDLAGGAGDDGDEPALWVFADRDRDFAFVHNNWRKGIEPWAFGLPYRWPGAPSARAHTVTDSPIYRPGDVVRFRTLVRRLVPNGFATPDGEKLAVAVTDGQGEKVHEQTYPLSAYGSVHGQLALAAGAGLGTYRIEVKLGAESVDAGSFLVEQYRPATIHLEVEEAPATAAPAGHLPGDCADFAIRARYHFGGAVSEGAATTTLTSSETTVRIAALSGFDHGEPYRADDRYHPAATTDLGQGEVALGADGSATQELALAVAEAPRAIAFEATVKDADGRPVSARTGFVLHPADLYLGIRLHDWGVAAGQPLELDLLAARADGSIAPGSSVEVDVLRRVWNVVRRRGVGSFYSYDSTVEDTLVDHQEVETWDAARTLTVRPALAGTYLVRARGRDAAGRAAESTASFYAWGGDVAGFARYDHDRIDLVPDRESYLPGEVARVLVKSPFEDSDALVTVERDGVERYETTCVSGSAALIEVPILDSDAPTVFVSALLTRGRIEDKPGASGLDLGKPQVRVGYATLNVRAPDRKLAVEVKPERGEYRPGDRVEVALAVPGLGPERAELTVLALDEAVLDVAGSAPWDPFAVFYAPRPLGVSTADTRLQLVGRRHFGQKGEARGGGGGEGEVFRRSFRASAFFAADLETDPGGRARVSFTLPDNLTTFRIVALAATRRDRFGDGQARVVVTKPVVTTPSVARFLESGDRAEVGVVVHNRTGTDGVAEIGLTATGVTVEGAASTRLAIAAGAAAESRFTVVARGEGAAALRFTTRLNGESDHLEWKLPVEDRAPIDVYATYGTLADADAGAGAGPVRRTVALKVPAGVRPDRGGLEVALASSLAGGLSGPLDWMRRYPWDCLEQRLSRAVAYGAAARYPGRIGLDPDEIDRDRAYATRVLAELGSFQDGAGAFSYWPGTPADPYLTGYALWTLRVLSGWGLAVDAEPRQRGLQAAESIVREDLWPWWYSEAARREVRAFLLAVIGRESKLDPALVERSVADRDKTSVFGVAALLDATAAAPGKASTAYASVRRTLLGRAGATAGDFFFEEVADDGLAAVLTSPVRGNAMALLALAGREPDWPNLAPLMRWTMLDEKAGRWDTTHEIAWGMMAAAAYLDGHEPDAPSFTVSARLDGELIGEQRFEGFEAAPVTVKRPAGRLAPGRDASLELVKAGPGRLYYTMRLAVAAAAAAEPVNAGLQVARRYQREDGRAIEPGAGIARGDLVRVVVTLTAQSLRHFVVVDDPLPAGFETVNFNLATSARGEAKLLDEKADNGWIAHQELRDDRAVAYAAWVEPGDHSFTYLARATSSGRFLAPAPRAEEMYSPETRGRGRPAEVVVRSAEPIATRLPARRQRADEATP